MLGGNYDGMMVMFYSTVTGFKLKFKSQNASAAATDRIITLQGGGGTGDLTMDGPSSTMFIYTGGRWVMWNKNQ